MGQISLTSSYSMPPLSTSYGRNHPRMSPPCQCSEGMNGYHQIGYWTHNNPNENVHLCDEWDLLLNITGVDEIPKPILPHRTSNRSISQIH